MRDKRDMETMELMGFTLQLLRRMGYTNEMFFVCRPLVLIVRHSCQLTTSIGFPDPFAVATVGGEQTHTTSVIKKTLNPYWNEIFDLYDSPFCKVSIPHRSPTNIVPKRSRVNEDSILAIQIFDQKKFKKKDQGFLGVINVRIGDVIDTQMGGDGAIFSLHDSSWSMLD